MGNRSTKNISPKKALSDGFFGNLRPLYNSNMAKVSIVKWSQNWIFVDGTPFFGPTPDFEIALKTAIFKIFGYARNGTSVNKNPFLRPLYNRYFCHITIVKWSRIIQKSIKKCVFWDIFILGPFSIKFPIIAVRALRQGKGQIKNGFQSDFLGPYDIPHGYKCQATQILDLKFLCTTIPL